ncbi:putative transportin [Schistosoma mansoni]|uniref:putative transportin n=1 Tax=Schistosoma mansoni TaxID=6183 RepID=UPI00019B3634|nr:putative transportin [Schistosoma mansoni]|eukprot:XP_018654629.1 putative transportin [Schistosoma mansoni]
MVEGSSLSVESVLSAIDALYMNPDTSIKEQASKWLCEFQKSVYAWQISDQLLYMNRDLNSCYFGAQTIRKKIQCHFTELPGESHEGLKNSLLQHVRELRENTSLPIANQLCLAVADLFCHMVQWKDGIKDIVSKLSEAEVSCSYLIDILKFIPEEMNSSTLRLGMNRRHALMSQFEGSKQAKSEQMVILAKVYNCLASWWDNTGIMVEHDVPIDPLLNTAFAILRNPSTTPESTFDAASQWVLALLYQCKQLSNSNSELLRWLQENIYSLVSIVQECSNSVASALGSIQQQEQLELYKDRCTCLAHIFSSLARTLRPPLVDQPTSPGSGGFGDLRTMECILVVLEIPPPLGSRELASITFHALHSLADDAIRHRSMSAAVSVNQGPLESSVNNSNASTGVTRPVAALIPYFTRVVVALTSYCPSNTSDLESTDELRDFREDVHDLMQDILGLVGAEAIFVELYNYVQKLQMLAMSENAQASAYEVLRESEACLFMLTTVAKRLSPRDPEEHISNLISKLVLPGLTGPCPPPLQEVGCMLYMELAHWAACHPQLRRQIVNQLIEIIEKPAGVESQSLQPGQKLAVGAALSALGSLCAVYRATPTSTPNGDVSIPSPCNSDSLRLALIDEHWQDLVNRVAYNLPRLAWVPIHDATHFFAGIGRGLMCSVGTGGGGVEFDPRASRQAFPMRVAQICSVSLECLSKLMDGNVPIEGSDTLSDPRVWLDYLAALFRTFNCLLRRLGNPSSSQWDTRERNAVDRTTSEMVLSAQDCLAECLQLVREVIWPVVTRVLTHYASRMRPMEHVCRLIRFIVRCFSVHLRDLLPELAEKIVLSYTTGGQHSSFLYLTSVLVDEFGEQLDCRVGLVNVYEALSGPTLKSISGSGLIQQPHTVEDLFRLCTRLVQHCAAVFLTSSRINLNELCDTAVSSLNLCCAGPGAGSSSDDTPDPNSPSNDESSSSSASTSASAAAARFFIELIIFTNEACEETPMQVVQILVSGRQLPTPSCQSALAAQNVIVWLTYSRPTQPTDPSNMNNCCGGQRLVSALLQACCLGLMDERFPEMADILYHLKVMINQEMFLNWLKNAVANLSTIRTDGLVQATQEQITDFQDVVMNSSRSSTIVHALDSFSRLFR